MKFNSYQFVVALEKACEHDKDMTDAFDCNRAYGRMCGFFTSALASLDLTESQVEKLNRMLEVAKKG